MAQLKDPMAAMIAKLTALLAGPYVGAKLVLYSNNVTITETTVLGDFTPCTFPGYSDQTLSGWSTPTDDGSHHAASTPSPASFTPSGSASGNIYGAFIADSGGTHLLDAGQFDSAPLNVPDGTTLVVTPTVQQGSIY